MASTAWPACLPVCTVQLAIKTSRLLLLLSFRHPKSSIISAILMVN